MAPGDDPEDSPEYTVEYLWDDEIPVSTAIIQALCAIEDVDPVDSPEDLGITLHDHIDPDALNTLVADGSGEDDIAIRFALKDYAITVTDTGRVFVRLYD